MFRHFGIDPTPSRIMRNTAPAVYEWVARMWNARRGATCPPCMTTREPLPNDAGITR